MTMTSVERKDETVRYRKVEESFGTEPTAPKTVSHHALVEVMEFDDSTTLDDLIEFYAGSNIEVIESRFNMDRKTFCWVRHRKIGHMTFGLEKGRYAVRINDKVFKPVSAAELYHEWGITV